MSGGIILRRPDDMHVHLREGRMLRVYARDAARFFARALVMPNTIPPVNTPEGLTSYRSRINQAAPGLLPLMTFKLNANMGASGIRALKAAGAVAGKYYPRGVTTNSEDGMAEIESVFPAVEAMEREGIVLCIHGESPAGPAFDRERRFLPELVRVVEAFPRLRVVLEHVSSQAGIDHVLSLPDRVAATVTVHHLLYTTDDLLADRLEPHLFCKPIIKSAADRDSIVRAVLSGNPKLFFGSDSAPHPRAAKEREHGAAGVYSMPVGIFLLAEFFSARDAVDKLENFVSRYGAEFYNLPLNDGTIALERRAWRVPRVRHGVVPLAAGRELEWSLR